jgi:hypothetical protein
LEEGFLGRCLERYLDRCLNFWVHSSGTLFKAHRFLKELVRKSPSLRLVKRTSEATASVSAWPQTFTMHLRHQGLRQGLLQAGSALPSAVGSKPTWRKPRSMAASESLFQMNKVSNVTEVLYQSVLQLCHVRFFY